MKTDKIIPLSQVKNKIGSYEKIADLVFENKLEVCFKFNGYSAFIIYEDGANGTVCQLSSNNKIFVAEHCRTNLYEVIGGTDTVYTTSVAKRCIDDVKTYALHKDEMVRGWVLLELDANISGRLKYLIDKFDSICHTTLFAEFGAEMYPLKLTRENLYISSISLDNYLSQSKKSEKSPAGISFAKAKAQKRILEIANLTWINESKGLMPETKLLPMARKIRGYLKEHEPNIYNETKSDESVKELIKAVAPSYAKKGGPPTKHLINLITDEST